MMKIDCSLMSNIHNILTTSIKGNIFIAFFDFYRIVDEFFIFPYSFPRITAIMFAK